MTDQPIDLGVFCHPDRPELVRPFSIDGWTYASDGAFLVRVPRRDDVGECESDFAAKVLAVVSAAAALRKPHYSPAPKFELPEPLEKKVRCFPCDGSGKAHRRHCPDCQCECPVCHGTGERIDPQSPLRSAADTLLRNTSRGCNRCQIWSWIARRVDKIRCAFASTAAKDCYAMPGMIGTALALAHRSLAVFPCVPREKRPATANGCKDATTDADTIRQWWTQEPDYNVAIATGATSAVFAIDVDGLDAEAELRKLEADHGKLPATVEVITARGRHLYFRMPGAPIRNSAGKVAAGIDVRGDGGYVLVPPSMHPSGKAYAWSVDSAATVADAPAWLLAKVAEPGRKWQTAGTSLGMARADGGRRVRRPAQCRAGADHGLPVAAPYRPGVRRRACAKFQHDTLRPAAGGKGSHADCRQHLQA